MTAATPKAPTDARDMPAEDPEHYRMTIGEHLEELRWHIVRALLGFVVVLIPCLLFGRTVVSYFLKPAYDVLQSRHLNPQFFYAEMSEPFMVFIEISFITAAAVSAPWIVYQIWRFIASGLYKHERKWVTRYIPLSIGLLIAGMLFVYFLVLPWTVQFFIDFGNDIPFPSTPSPMVATTRPIPTVPSFDGDPINPPEGGLWRDATTGDLKLHVGNRTLRLVYSPDSLVAPHLTLETYIDMVVMMLVTFGLSFQLPLVIMAILKIGIVEAATLRRARRMVYFVLVILAAAITPGDVITATLALTVPLILLYELGIYLGTRGQKVIRADE